MVNIRDDERYLLAISRPSGCLVACPAISPSRMTGIRRKWTLMGWLNPGSDTLTRKAMACKVALPDLSPEVELEPIEFTPAAETVIESDYDLPEEESIECESIDDK